MHLPQPQVLQYVFYYIGLVDDADEQNADLLSATTAIGEIILKDFGTLEFEKYLSLKNYGSAKKTWFFRLDFKSGMQTARYLFFFSSPSYILRPHTDVTLYICREEPSGSFHYERLDTITAPNVPNIVEIGYKAASESFIVRQKNGNTAVDKVDVICRHFVQDVVEKHFCG